MGKGSSVQGHGTGGGGGSLQPNPRLRAARRLHALGQRSCVPCKGCRVLPRGGRQSPEQEKPWAAETGGQRMTHRAIQPVMIGLSSAGTPLLLRECLPEPRAGVRPEPGMAA